MLEPDVESRISRATHNLIHDFFKDQSNSEMQDVRKKVHLRTELDIKPIDYRVFKSGTNTRQKWKTTRDTEEIAAVMRPTDYPFQGMPYVPPQFRFSTHSQRENNKIFKVAD